MRRFQREFLECAIEKEAVRFGDFTLKSGRKSPYFFNFGAFDDGRSLSVVAAAFAELIVECGVEFDVMFGPAYKGIPLVAVVAAQLFEKHGISKPFVFNRKEQKEHGEGGVLVGATATLKEGARVLVVDDVITAGTAVREALRLIEATKARVTTLVVSFDREERMEDGTGRSAVQALAADEEVAVLSVANLGNLICLLRSKGDETRVAVADALTVHYEAKCVSSLSVLRGT
eukprot:Polyplicarium_translucidae@DN2693_c0_g1_i2.p2